ncbi:hypothetical protein YC2023_113467 [Brassica napus]
MDHLDVSSRCTNEQGLMRLISSLGESLLPLVGLIFRKATFIMFLDLFQRFASSSSFISDFQID